MQINQENFLDAHKICLDKVSENDYYMWVLDAMIIHEPEKMNPKTAEEVCSFWNTFWCLLPDSRAIHREPFNLICDLAEGSYVEEF